MMMRKNLLMLVLRRIMQWTMKKKAKKGKEKSV